MFTSSKDTAAKENEKPKKSKYASSFGASWKKKDADKNKISIALKSDTAEKVKVSKYLNHNLHHVPTDV